MSSVTSRPERSRQSAGQRRVRAEEPPSVPLVRSDLQPETFWEQFWAKLNGDEGAGYALSFVVHVILLGLLSIPIYHQLQSEPAFTTLVQKQDNEQVLFDEPVDTLVELDSPDSGAADVTQSRMLNLDSTNTDYIPDLNIAATTAVEGSVGDDGASGEGAGGVRTAEPQNAIKQGSFSVWPWPIVGNKLNGGVIHTEPGASPKVFQNYHIVIRIKVPGERRTVSLLDFSGTVVGTDNYHQKIPEDAYYFNTRGVLVRAALGRRIPVIDGTAEILIRVPGAALPSVKDTITVRSRLLDEEQEIELQFEARN